MDTLGTWAEAHDIQGESQRTGFLQPEESQNGLGWKRPYRSSSSNHPAMGRDLPLNQAAQSRIQPGLDGPRKESLLLSTKT